MAIMQQVMVMLVTLGVLIAFHEYGHFLVARRCGVKVLRFSIGFGPVLFRLYDKQGTEFAISALPLGGYVKMLDERDTETELTEQDKSAAFNNKPVGQRIAIASAGPIANFLLAIVVYWFVFLQGTVGLSPQIFSVEPGSPAEQSGLVEGLQISRVDNDSVETVRDVALALTRRIGESGNVVIHAGYPDADASRDYLLPIEDWLEKEPGQIDVFGELGIGFYRPQIAPMVASVLPDSAAQQAGLQSGDKIIAADGEPVSDWMEWVEYVQQRAGQSIALEFQRDGELKSTRITPAEVRQNGRKIGQVGIRVEMPEFPEHLQVRREYSMLSAWVPALTSTWDMTTFTLSALKKMLLGDISYKQLSGPISIAQVATESAYSGIYSYLSLLALLSVSLGILNLLPIPVLDGGHILFYLIEWIKGSPVPEKIQIIAFQIGMVVILSVMLLAIFNDLSRL